MVHSHTVHLPLSALLSPCPMCGTGESAVDGQLHHAPYGLEAHSVDWYLAFLEAHGFNALRLFVPHEAVLSNARVPPSVRCDGCETDLHHVDHSPYLVGKTYVEMIGSIARSAARRGMLVLLAAHAKMPPPPHETLKLWYSDIQPIEEVKRSWTAIASALCSEVGVFAVDVHNEPFGSTWGEGKKATDWDRGAADLGDHILSLCPRWLIFVQGIAQGRTWCTATPCTFLAVHC